MSDEATKEVVHETEEQLLEAAEEALVVNEDEDVSLSAEEEDDSGGSDSGDDSGGSESDSADTGEEGEPADEKDVGEGESEGGGEEGGEPDEKKQVEKPISKKLALISKKEREIRNKEKELKTREQSVKDREQFLTDLDRNPIEALHKRYGKKIYEEMTNYYLDKDKYKQNKQGEKLDELIEKQAKDEEERKKQEEIDAQVKAANEYFDDIREAAKSPDYELINARGLHEEAVIFAKLYYDKHKEVLEPAAAAAEVERYLREELRASLETKYGKSLVPSRESGGEEEKPKKKNTLRNKVSTQPAAPKSPRDFSEEDTIKEAEALLEKAFVDE